MTGELGGRGEERHATGVLEPYVFECCTAADGDVVGVLPGVGMGSFEVRGEMIWIGGISMLQSEGVGMTR